MQSSRKSKLSKNLTKSEINQICRLKNSHWKYSLNSQIKWFKKNINEDDIHNFITHRKKIISYTCLKKRSLYLKKNLTKKYYLYFDTCIVKKNFRNLGIGNKIMLLNSNVIKKNKLPSFLLCEKHLMEFYSQFGWKKLSKTNIRIKDHTIKKKNIMHFNFKRLKTKFSIFIYQ